MNSLVIKSKKELTVLYDMLPKNKKPVKFNLLYRASENDFAVSKFWQKCDKIPDTVTLVKTKANKIIGGYTPLCWDKSKQYTYQ